MAFREVLELFVRADVQGAVTGIRTVGDTAERELGQKAISATDRWANRMVYAGAGLVGVAAVAGAGLFRLSQDAVALGETVNKNNEVFDENAAAIERWADGASDDFGQSKQQALAAAASFGNMFLQLDLGLGPATRMSKKMVELASDYASFHDADITEILLAQQAAFRGEYDAVQRYVPAINAAAVEQRALADTGKASNAELTAGEKAAATYALMLEGAGKAVGDYDRTSDSAANKQRRLNAEWANMRAELGAGVIPVLSKAIDVGSGAIGMFEGLDDATGGSLGTLATYGTVAAGASGGLLLIAGGALKARHTVLDFAESFPRLASSIGAATSAAAPWIAAAALIVGAGYGIKSAIDGSSESLDVHTEALMRLTDAQMEQAAEQLLAIAGYDRFKDKIGEVAAESVTTAQKLVEASDLPKRKRQELLEVIEKEIAAQKRSTQATTDDAAATRDHADATTEDAEAILAKTDATEASFSSEIRALKAADDLNTSIDDLNAARLEAARLGGVNAEANQAVVDSEIEVREKVLASADAAAKYAEDQAKARGETDTAKFANEAYVQQLLAFRDTLAPDSPLRTYLDGLLYRLGLAGQPQHSVITADGSQSINEADRVATAWEGASGRIKTALGSAQGALDNIGRSVGETYSDRNVKANVTPVVWEGR